LAVFNIKQGNDYTESFYNKNTGFEVGYYTAKEMKALYPDGGIRVAGQVACGKEQVGTIVVDGIEEAVFRPTNSARYKTVGYIELTTGSFIAVKKDNLLALIMLFLAGLLALICIIFGLTYAIKTGGEPEETTTTPPYLLDENQQQGLGQLDLPEKVDTSTARVTATGIVEMKLKAGQKEQNFILTNSEKNKNICFMQFTIYIDKNEDGAIDSGDEMIYQSQLVQPGYSISKFSLLRPLDAGEYKVLVHEQPYSYDQARTKLNNMVISTKIIAE
jgi:hypothetical protein